MGKVQRGRKKDHRANRRVIPKPAIQPRIPIVDNSQAEQAKIEAACELEVYRVLNAGNRKFFEEAEEETQAFLTCQPIFFSDLPEKFALANVPLYSRKHIPFVQCDVCTGYTAKATVSECGHRFCDHCSRISQSRRGVFCQYCRKQFQYNVLGVSEDFLSSLLLSCRCGFEGTLTEIRLHNTTKGGKCRDNRVSLVPLLRPNHNYERNAEWKERSLYLDEVGYHERWSLMPPELFDPEYEKMKKNPALPHAYLDFDSDGMYLGRIYIELHEDVVPKTVAKFLNILKDPKGYRGTEIEFMVPDTFFQVKPMSGYGRTVRDFFEDESFKLKHDRPGAVALTNFGPNSNQSGFYITAVEMPWRDGSNVVFGYVIGTHKIINRICQLAREDGSTARRVKIIGCGIVKDWILPSVFSAFEIFDST